MKKIGFFLLLAPFISDANNTNRLHRYMWANYQMNHGNQDMAAKWYRTINKQKHLPYTGKGYIFYLHHTHQVEKLIHVADMLKSEIKSDPDIRLLYARAIKTNGKLQESAEEILNLYSEFPEHFEIVFNTIEIFIGRKEPENAITVIDKYLECSHQKNNHFMLYYIKSQLYMELNKLDLAYKNISICIEKQPRFDKGWLLCALIQEQKGAITDAIKGYNAYLDLCPSQQANVKKHILELHIESERQQAKSKMVKDNYSRCLEHLNAKRFDRARALSTHLLAADPLAQQYRLMHIQVLMSLKHYEQVLSHIIKWITESNAQRDEWLATLHLLHRTELPINSILNAFEHISKQLSSDATTLFYLADLYTRTGKKEEAIKTYQNILILNKDKIVAAKLHYQIACSYYHTANYQAMHDSLELGHRCDPESVPINNLLAYYYGTQNNFDKALKHITTAMAHAANNPHVHDTQALIWYKQGEHQKALDAWKKLVQTAPTDTTILVHCAQASKKLGKDDQANLLLKQAYGNARNDQEYALCTKLTTKWNNTNANNCQPEKSTLTRPGCEALQVTASDTPATEHSDTPSL